MKTLCGAVLPARIARTLSLLPVLFCCPAIVAAANSAANPQQRAAEIFRQAGISGGLVVHIGCGDGRLTAALRVNDRLLVQGLDTDRGVVARARARVRAEGLYGPVTVDQFSGKRLPYVDNLVNLVVANDLGQVSMQEVLRVLCPHGVALIERDGRWTKRVKPRPAEIDQWTHYLHDASNDAVSHDTVVAPPRRLQWVGGPRWTRHHDRMSGVSAVVSAHGRVFSIIDEAPRASILIPPVWRLVARDAFNGTLLWKRSITHWQTHLWPLKSGPAQLPRRLVAAGDRVYVTLQLDGPVTALDAATGATLQSFAETKGAEEIILSDGLLLVLVNPHAETPPYAGLSRIQQANRGRFYDEKPRRLVAIRTDSGDVAWAVDQKVLPVTLAADQKRVYFHDGTRVKALDKPTGDLVWQSAPIPRADIIQSFFAPILVVHRDVVLFAGGETAGQQTGSWYTSGKDTMTALAAATGKTLWSAYHPPSGYRSAEDLFAIKGTVWTGETTSGRAKGWFTGRDLHTGEVLHRFAPDVDTYWFHHRCYRGKATDNFVLTSRTGTEFIDIDNEKWLINDWVRGACLYGIMPANGLLYAPPHPCACYLESKLDGFNALAPARPGPRLAADAAASPRLETGPAFSGDFPVETTDADWPTYRHDAARSGATTASVPADLQPAWQTDVGSKLTSPVIAGGTVYVAAVDRHAIVALDSVSGQRKWQFTAGGRIDSPPTVYQGRILFGSADGYVYCLRATDGLLAWRFRAAPADERLVAYDQVESVWPVPGNVMVLNDVLYCVAGRSMFIDGGLHLWRLDPKTGRDLSETVLGERDTQTGKPLQDYVSWLNMPTAMPDILSSDGRYVYMRSQPFQLDGTRLPLHSAPRGADADQGAVPAVQNPDFAHLFSPTGFGDDGYWHRSYWLYGSTFVSGWSGYYRAGKTAPAGKVLCFDASGIYGFGRQPKYFRWSTPIEYQLFAAKKVSVPPRKPTQPSAQQSLVRVTKSKTLNPAKTPLTVEAWVKTNARQGVIVAHGGGVQGYALYLKGRRPQLTVRVDGRQSTVTSRTPISNRWVHLAGVLTAQKELKIYVDGKLAGTAKASAMIASDPTESMEIGADLGTHVGDYGNALPLRGLIDEVAVYHGELSADEIARHAQADAPPTATTPGPVARYCFDQGTAVDRSGHGNNGTLEGVAVVAGKFGKALRLSGAARAANDFVVKYRWTKELPVLGRALALADGTLFVAGPPDLVDEPEALRQIDDPQVQSQLARQEAAIQGAQGGRLWAIATTDGTQLAHYQLDSPPIFDGLAAAQGRLYMSTSDGHVVCFAGE